MTKALLLTALLTGAAMVAPAQQNSFDAQISNIALLRMPAVQQELAITPKQSNAIAKAGSSQAAAMQKARYDQRTLAAIRAQIRQNTLAQISPSQLVRLREISLQQMGVQSLVMPAVAAKVGLSAEQRNAIATMYANTNKSMIEAMKKAIAAYSNGSNDPRVVQEASVKAQQSVDFEEAKRQTGSRALTILTNEQRAVWDKLLGRRFQVVSGPPMTGGGAQP